MKPIPLARIRILAPGAARPYYELVYVAPDETDTHVAVSVRAEELPTAIARLICKLAELNLVVELVPDGAPSPTPIPETSVNGQAPTGDTVSKLTTQRLRDVLLTDQGLATLGAERAAPATPARTPAPSRRRAKGGAR